MLALVILGLVTCESATSFRLNNVTENQDELKYYPSNPPRYNYDSQLENLNVQKKNFNVQKEYLDRQIENIEMQKDNLDTEIEKFDRKKENFDREIDKLDAQKDDIDREIDKLDSQKDGLDREIDKLNRQKDDVDREIDNVYRRKDNFDRNIDDLNGQKDQLDSEIDKVDLEIENHYIYIDRHTYKIERAAVKDNEYRITINLPGFNKKEIVVKSRKGLLTIQALHDVLGEPKRSFQNIRSLPYFVTGNGSWSYKWDVLSIVFPIIKRTRHETVNEVYRNDKNNTISSTEKAKVPKKDNSDTDTYSSNQEVDIENTSYSVTANDEALYTPVVY